MAYIIRVTNILIISFVLSFYQVSININQLYAVTPATEENSQLSSKTAGPNREQCLAEEVESRRNSCLELYCDGLGSAKAIEECHAERCSLYTSDEEKRNCRDIRAITLSEDALSIDAKYEDISKKLAMVLGISIFLLDVIWAVFSMTLAGQSQCSAASGITGMAAGLVSAIGEIIAFLHLLIKTKKIVDNYKRGSFFFGVIKAKTYSEADDGLSNSIDRQIEPFNFLIEQQELNLENMRIRVAIDWLAASLLWLATALAAIEIYAISNPGSAPNLICPGNRTAMTVFAQISPPAVARLRSGDPTVAAKESQAILSSVQKTKYGKNVQEIKFENKQMVLTKSGGEAKSYNLDGTKNSTNNQMGLAQKPAAQVRLQTHYSPAPAGKVHTAPIKLGNQVPDSAGNSSVMPLNAATHSSPTSPTAPEPSEAGTGEVTTVNRSVEVLELTENDKNIINTKLLQNNKTPPSLLKMST